MDKLYRAASFVIRKVFRLPEAYDNKDTQGALLLFCAVATLLSSGWSAVPWLVQFLF